MSTWWTIRLVNMNLKALLKQGQTMVEGVLQRPEQATQWIRQLPPFLSKPALAYASELLEPGFWGSGLRIKHLSRERIWLLLPHRRRQSLASGEMQLGSLVSVGEWAFRLLWAQHFHFSSQRLWLSQARIECEQPLTEDLWLRGELFVNDLERIQLQLQKTGQLQEEWSLSILNSSERQLGRIFLKVHLQSEKLLPAAHPSS